MKKPHWLTMLVIFMTSFSLLLAIVTKESLFCIFGWATAVVVSLTIAVKEI